MALQNISLLNVLLLLFISLNVTTISRKQLTYKGIQIILIIINCFLFLACLKYSNYFLFFNGVECVNFKLNSNNWANINYEIYLKINSLSFLFILLVVTIGFCTNLYIFNYFKYEERGEEFTLLINWFIFSMIFLVVSNNFFSLILGWELIGLTSFLLINFWRFKITTLACSFKAFTFNKISDIFLMIGFCLLFNGYKTGNVDTLLSLIQLDSNNSLLYKSGLCILISSSIKSAQFIGHLWLPDSMEAPVPASSLIHSATLVSAGIYLLLKFQILFNLCNLMSLIFFLGSLTACFGGLVAASQSDMKKLLAYSTISHCGFIFASISLNNIVITITYLYLHGLFKALTFFCAGSIIKFNGSQDTRQMGMNKNQLINIVTLTIASINLGGLPFTFGYLYKYLFLNYLILQPINFLGYGFNLIGLLCSAVYVYKIIYYSCFDFRKGPYQTINTLIQHNKNPLNMLNQLFHTYTTLKVIAFSIIYLFSTGFFIIVKLYILKSYNYIYLNTVEISDYQYLVNWVYVKSHLISIFYILFVVVIASLTLLNWREDYFFIEKLTIKIFFIEISVFYLLTCSILRLVIKILTLLC